MQIQLHIWHPYVVGTLRGLLGGGECHIWLEKQEDPQGASDPREGQQVSETPCCMAVWSVPPFPQPEAAQVTELSPEITTSSLWLPSEPCLEKTALGHANTCAHTQCHWSRHTKFISMTRLLRYLAL